METETSNKYSVLMLEKGMGVLELLADYHSGLTIQEMCSHLSYPKTTIYRLANTLLEMAIWGKMKIPIIFSCRVNCSVWDWRLWENPIFWKGLSNRCGG